jgi:tRNA nucleotidyltransferase (CCA-adding enzyme)
VNNAKKICKKLITHGFEAYIVGGAVRDIFRKVDPKDYDICTNASPEEVKKIFSNYSVLNIGEAFGITVVVMNGEMYEIAQFRRDGKSSDGRHPDSISICNSIEEDLARRDFTINAIAFDVIHDVYIDPFNGKSDINQRTIKFVGNPDERIAEDNLRILRTFRFASVLNFSIEENTFNAILNFFNNGGDFSKISMERITAEFGRIITGQNAFEVIKIMSEYGILDKIIPEVAEMRKPHNNVYHTEVMEPFGNSILAHVLYVFKFTCEKTDSLKIRLAALLHDIGKDRCRETKPDGHDRFLFHDRESARMADEILRRMKFDNNTIKEVVSLVFDHMRGHDLTKMKNPAAIRRLMGKPYFSSLLVLLLSDTLGTAGSNGVPNIKEANHLTELVNNYNKEYPEMLPTPLVTGEDLLLAGKTPGPEFGKALKVAYDYQLRGETNKTKMLKHALSTMK